MKTIFIILVLCICCYSSGWDTTIVIKKDLTYDGIDDNIALSISMQDWSLPANWNIKIESKGKTIFNYKANDKEIDSSFYDPNFVSGCNNYLECKKKWYKNKFDNFISEIIYGEKSGGGEYSLYTNLTAKYYQEKLGISSNRSKKMATSFKSFFKNHTIIGFRIPYTPVVYGDLMTWDLQTKTFIPWFAP